MTLSRFERQAVEAVMGRYCEQRVPPQARGQVRVFFRVRGESVTLLESQPSFVRPSEWIETVVAQFRRDQDSGKWVLYCADRNSRWHLYHGITPAKTLRPLLAEVDRDPTGIFWG